MVADWDPHVLCMIQWPGSHPVWDPYITEAEAEYAALVKTISKYEDVLVITQAGSGLEVFERYGLAARRVELPFTESWIRDTGPVFVRLHNGRVHGVDFRFNGWGHKFSTSAADDNFASTLCAELRISVTSVDIVLEGGGIATDGQGTIIATEEAVLNANRNPGAERDHMTSILRRHLGAQEVIWLPYGLIEDSDTDGHVDNVACFVGPGQIMCQVVSDRSNTNYSRLVENMSVLLKARDATGRRLEVIPFDHLAYVDFPSPRGRRTSSYLNLYLANGAVVVPVVGGRSDESAVEALAEMFPDREVVTASSRYLAYGGGGVHCVTLGRPAGACDVGVR